MKKRFFRKMNAGADERTQGGVGESLPHEFGVTVTLHHTVQGNAIGAKPLWGANEVSDIGGV